MTSNIHIPPPVKTDSQKADKAFSVTKDILFTIGVIGQWIFVFYIVVFYGGIAASGTYEKVNEHLGHGVIEGDWMGNFMLAVHIALAAIIMFGGPIQFITKIRSRFPVFHRWNGRVYLTTALIATFAGLYMIYTRGAHGGITMMMGNTLNAILIITFSALAWRTAMQRNFRAHRKWALRAFLMISGVWFFRVGYGLWILLTGFTAPGTNATLNGPFDIFLGFGHSLIPLLIIEGYFYAKAHQNPRVKKIAAVAMGILSLMLTGGLVILTMVFWFPQL